MRNGKTAQQTTGDIMYRLYIEIPLGTDEESAIKYADQLVRWTFIDVDCKDRLQRLSGNRIEVVNYKLENDQDKQKYSPQKYNYLNIDENGDVSTKECKIEY